MRGDWGCVDAEDEQRNFASLFSDENILSAYPIDPPKPCADYGDYCLWITTEADRSVTIFLLPSEY